MAGALVERIEISRSALVHNIREFRRLVGRRRTFMAVVKANAYGHGLLEVARIALGAGVDWLGVNSVEEGATLRDAGIKAPVLVLGYVPFRGLEEAAVRELRLTVYNRETLGRLSALAVRLGKTVPVHVKVETGTWRQGVAPKDVVSFVKDAAKRPGLVVEGLSSHFANIEDTTKHDYPRRQLEAFRASRRELEGRGISVPLMHMSCTASTILFPEKDFTWKARIAQVKKAPAGAYIGYGCTFRTTRPTVLAVVPVGYFDGYDRGLSNAAHVLVKGRRAPVRGRVAMDFFMADVTDIPGVRLEDEVTLLGQDGRERVGAEDLAALAGTISYEILARINPLIPRVVV
jgi:alanine racemase